MLFIALVITIYPDIPLDKTVQLPDCIEGKSPYSLVKIRLYVTFL